MVVLSINKIDYRVFESWDEITVKKAREIYDVALTIPEELNLIYKENSKGVDADKDQISIYKEELKSIEKDLDSFYMSCIKVLSDIPIEVVKKINIDDLRICYDSYLFRFIFGVLYFPLEELTLIEGFEKLGKKYVAPKNEFIMGKDRPFANEHASVFCDASDLDIESRKTNKYKHAELITAIIFREKNVDYSERQAMDTAWSYQDIITCDIYHSALYYLSSVNVALKSMFPNLYQKGDMNSNSASKASGLADFGWMNSIMTVAEMGVLNKSDLTPFESVRQSNLYDLMTVLSNMRANVDFNRIFAEKNNKK